MVFNSGVSTNHEEWGSFGNYIGGIGGIILSCSLFYYTYTIDKDHRKKEKNTQVLKLIDIVGESLACIERWEKLNFDLATNSINKRDLVSHEHMENERNNLIIKLWTNYKITQVLVYHLFDMDIPDLKELHETKAYFIQIFNSIKLN